MNCEGTDALEQALALRSAPSLRQVLRSRPLPAGVLVVLEIAGGNRQTVLACARKSAESPRVLAEAAVLFVQQVLFFEGADHYRLLGVGVDAKQDTIHEHYRWLLRWLHPDRGEQRWETTFAERVTAAWNVLRSPERRAAYDAQLSIQPAPRQRLPRVAGLPPEPVAPVVPGRMLPWLPVSTLAGLAMASALILVFWYRTDQRVRVPHWQAETVGGRQDRDIAGDAARRALAADSDAEDELAPISAAADAAQTQAQADAVGPDESVAGDTAGASVAPPATSVVDDRPTVPAAVPVSRQSIGYSSSSRPAGDEPRASGPQSGPILLPQGVVAAMPRPAPVTLVQPDAARSGPARFPHPSAPPATAKPTEAGPTVHGSPEKAALTASVAAEPHNNHPAPVRGGESVGVDRIASIRMVPSAISVAAAGTTPARSAVAQGAVASTASGASLAPAASSALGAVPAPPVAPPPAAPLPAAQAVAAVPRQFVAAYAQGDLDRMMALFSTDAVENRGRIDAIARDYRRLFADTSMRSLDLDALVWTIRPGRIVGVGPYVAYFRAQGGEGDRRVQGWIRIEAVPMKGGWKIQRLLHGEHR